MKFVFVILALLWFFQISVCGQERFVTVISIKANLRGTPSTTGKLISEVKQGDIFKILEERDSWYLVETPDYVGWLHKSTIQFGDSNQNTAKQLVLPKSDSCYGIMSPDIMSLMVPCPENIKPNYLPAEDDHGYDIAIVTVNKALLRESPKKDMSDRAGQCMRFCKIGEVSCRNEEIPCEGSFLNKGDLLVVLDKTPTNNWFNVINVETAKEGWVYISHLDLYYTRHPKSSVPVFEERKTESYKEPEITITNDTNRNLTLRLGSQIYFIESNSSRTIYITEGIYKFYASVPHAYPLMGEKSYYKGYGYTWKFFIK